MIANANYNSSPTASTGYGEEGTVSTVYLVAEPVMNSRHGSISSMSNHILNLLKEDEFYPEVESKKLIQMESKQFVPSVATRINRGRG